MTREEKLLALESMGCKAPDEVLDTYLLLAGQAIIAKAFPFGGKDAVEVPTEYDGLQLRIAQYLLDKEGANGETAHSENGISRTYESADIPPSMLKGVVPRCGVIT